MKQCSKCQQLKSSDEFWKSSTHRDGLHGVCKKCQYERRKQKGFKIDSSKIRQYNLKRAYGLTIDQYAIMAKDQNNQCKICGSHPSTLHVDHCHMTGIVRGLLCPQCNLGLGAFRDSPALLVSAKDYLSG